MACSSSDGGGGDGDDRSGGDVDADPGTAADAAPDAYQRPDASLVDADPSRPDARPGDPDARAPEPLADASAGTPDARPPDPTDPNLIDDLDDGNDHIVVTSTRRGAWFTFHDTTPGGTQTPGDATFTLTPGGPAGSGGFHVRTTGSGFTEWGAGVGFDLNTADGAPVKGKFNAGTFTGITFKAKGNVVVRFSVQTAAVLPTTLGGTCVPSTTAGLECEDNHGKSLTLTSSWQSYQVPFAQLMQEGWGKPATFDKAALTGVLVQTAPGATFDFALDDLSFY